jgi:hypothetical protein
MLECGHGIGEESVRFEYFNRFCPDGSLCDWGQSCTTGTCEAFCIGESGSARVWYIPCDHSRSWESTHE